LCRGFFQQIERSVQVCVEKLGLGVSADMGFVEGRGMKNSFDSVHYLPDKFPIDDRTHSRSESGRLEIDPEG
jgi:hypothetical protein